jgi:hypothetical protein
VRALAVVALAAAVILVVLYRAAQPDLLLGIDEPGCGAVADSGMLSERRL